MDDFNPSVHDKQSAEFLINELHKKRVELALQKRDIEIDLMALNKRVMSSTQRLPPQEYKDICAKQIRLKQKAAEIEKQIIHVKTEIRDKSLLLESIRDHLRTNRDAPSSPLKERLINLRNHYMEFASDATRVASLRTMASRFAEEIELILSDSF